MMEVQLSKVNVSDVQVTGNVERGRCRGVLEPVNRIPGLQDNILQTVAHGAESCHISTGKKTDCVFRGRTMATWFCRQI